MAASNPFGLHTVTPYLVVDGVEPLVEFVQKIFNATLRGEIRFREDGSVQHVEVMIGDSVIMMGEPKHDFIPMPSTIYLYVDDCDETYHKAIEAGAISVLPLEDYPHGDRYGGVQDQSGNIWWIATHIAAREK